MRHADVESEQTSLLRETPGSVAVFGGETMKAADPRAALAEIDRVVDALLSGAYALDDAAPPEVKAMLTLWRLLETEARALRARCGWTVLPSATA